MAFKGVINVKSINNNSNVSLLHQAVGPSLGQVSFTWPKESLSLAVLLIAVCVLAASCCAALMVLLAACCGSRRRDAVAEGADHRWLPGIGAIDYVPPSERSSVRVSLIVEEPTEGTGDPHHPSVPGATPSTSCTHTEPRPFREYLESPATPLLLEMNTERRHSVDTEQGNPLLERIALSKEEVAYLQKVLAPMSNGRPSEFERATHANINTQKDCMKNTRLPYSSLKMELHRRELRETVLNRYKIKRKRERKLKQLRKEIDMIEMKLYNVDYKTKSKNDLKTNFDLRTYEGNPGDTCHVNESKLERRIGGNLQDFSYPYVRLSRKNRQKMVDLMLMRAADPSLGVVRSNVKERSVKMSGVENYV